MQQRSQRKRRNPKQSSHQRPRKSPPPSQASSQKRSTQPRKPNAPRKHPDKEHAPQPARKPHLLQPWPISQAADILPPLVLVSPASLPTRRALLRVRKQVAQDLLRHLPSHIHFIPTPPPRLPALKPLSHVLGLRSIRTLLDTAFSLTSSKSVTSAGEHRVWEALEAARTQHRQKTAAYISKWGDVSGR